MKITGLLFGQGPGLPITFVPDGYSEHSRFDAEGLMTSVEVRTEDEDEPLEEDGPVERQPPPWFPRFVEDLG